MISDSFLTVERTNPKLKELLSGRGPGDEIPVPVQSLRMGLDRQDVTFQFISTEQARKTRPNILTLAFKTMRFEMLPFTLGPAVAGAMVAAAFAMNTIPIGLLICILMSLVLLHVGVFCLNDYFDHMGGVDRVNEKGGSRVIQNGWLRAWQVRLVGVTFLVLAALVALPVFLQRPEVFLFSIMTLGTLGLGYFLSRGQRAFPLLGLFVLFLLFGPMISVGTVWSLTGQMNFEALAYGTLLGLVTVSYVFNRQMLSLVVDQLSGLSTLPVRWGIDRSRRLLALGVAVVSMALVGHIGSKNLAAGFVSALPLLLPTFSIARNLQAVQSPVSSRLEKNLGSLRLYYLIATAVVVAFLLLVSLGVVTHA